MQFEQRNRDMRENKCTRRSSVSPQSQSHPISEISGHGSHHGKHGSYGSRPTLLDEQGYVLIPDVGEPFKKHQGVKDQLQSKDDEQGYLILAAGEQKHLHHTKYGLGIQDQLQSKEDEQGYLISAAGVQFKEQKHLHDGEYGLGIKDQLQSKEDEQGYLISAAGVQLKEQKHLHHREHLHHTGASTKDQLHCKADQHCYMIEATGAILKEQTKLCCANSGPGRNDKLDVPNVSETDVSHLPIYMEPVRLYGCYIDLVSITSVCF